MSPVFFFELYSWSYGQSPNTRGYLSPNLAVMSRVTNDIDPLPSAEPQITKPRAEHARLDA